MNLSSAIAAAYDLARGELGGAPTVRRHLGDLRGIFADSAAFEQRVRTDNPLVYTVSTLAPAEGEGQLHCGLGILMPGRVGSEYFLTRGHLHAWREAAEIYVCLRGEGAMLLEHETSGSTRLLPLRESEVVYVPGGTLHRTVNTGKGPLAYLGIHPAQAGHDYGPPGGRNFANVLVERDGWPVLLDRPKFLQALNRSV